MTRFPHPGRAASSWLRLPRRTARLRLTLLSGGLFLLAGAAVLAITYLLFDHTTQSGLRSFRSSGTHPSLSGPGRTTNFFPADPPWLRAAQAAQVAVDKHTLLADLGIALAVIATLALLLGWFVSGRMLRPVRTITATARKISSTNLHERLALDDADQEFKELGDTLDDLFARLEAAFEAQRHFVANASHELRSPLARERTLLQVARARRAASIDMWNSTSEALLASNREQEALIEALLALASSEGGIEHQERVDLSRVCDDVLLRSDLDLDRLGLHVETEISSAPLDGDRRLIERLVANLVDNAIGHNMTGGNIHVSTTAVDGHTVLTVANTGEVIPPDEVDRLFQPFQRLDPARTHHNDGHGLGLSIVRAIASAHGATIDAQPGSEGGLTVEVTFPRPLTTWPGQSREGSATRCRLTAARSSRR